MYDTNFIGPEDFEVNDQGYFFDYVDSNRNQIEFVLLPNNMLVEAVIFENGEVMENVYEVYNVLDACDIINNLMYNDALFHMLK